MRIGLYVVVGLYVFYLAVANVILRTSLLQTWLSADRELMVLSYDSAWSPYPGHVIVDDLRMRVQDSNVQFYLEIGHAEFDCDLHALPGKTFRVRGVRGRDVVFRLRHKLKSAVGQEARLAAYPKIEGFADPPVRAPLPDVDLPDDKYNLWTIDLRDVSTTLRELWIMEYRFAEMQEATVVGGFRLIPMRRLYLEPSSMAAKGGVFSIGEHALMAAQTTKLDVVVDDYDVRIPKDEEVFEHVDARIELAGELLDLGAVDATYLRGTGVAVAKGRGPLELVVRARRGVLTPETHHLYTTDDLRVTSGNIAFRGALEAIGKNQEHLLLDTKSAAATVAIAGKDALALENAAGAIALSGNDLRKEIGLGSWSASVGSVAAKDVARLGPVLPPSPRLAGGSATAKAWAKGTRGGKLDGHVELDVAQVKILDDDLEITTTGKLWTGVTSQASAQMMGFHGAGAKLTDTQVRAKNESESGFSVDATFEDAFVRYGDKSKIETNVGVTVKPGDKVLRFIAGLASLPKGIVEAPAGPEATARLRYAGNGKTSVIRLLEARDGALSARGWMENKDPTARGAFLVELGGIRAGVVLENGGTRVAPLVNADWLDKRGP